MAVKNEKKIFKEEFIWPFLETYACVSMSMCIYIYIYIERERERLLVHANLKRQILWDICKIRRLQYV